jgi:hypothetical protein
METKTLTKLARSSTNRLRLAPLRRDATGCRRCGGECSCTPEEIDAGGPA